MASRVLIRPPSARDQVEFLERARASRRLHGSWVQAPATPAQFKSYLARARATANCGLLVCERATGAIVGVITISNMVLGPFRSAYLGYYAFSGFEGQGLMKEGLAAVVRHGFAALKLHRLEANIQPSNAASIALVRTCGFQLEGYSPRYLKIAGRWRDHERWAILADRPPR